MNNLQKIVVLCATGIAIVVGGFFLLNDYIYHEKQGDDQMISTTVEEDLKGVIEEGSKNDNKEAMGEEQGVCFDHWRENPYILSPGVDTSIWNLYEATGFAIKHPNTIAVTQSEIVSTLNRNFKAQVTIQNLRRELPRFPLEQGLLYERLSDTWWKFEERCMPNEVGETSLEFYPIFLATYGDAGSFRYDYFVVAREVPEGVNYDPLIIQITTGYSGNDPAHAGFGEFQKTLESMIRTIEIRPASKG